MGKTRLRGNEAMSALIEPLIYNPKPTIPVIVSIPHSSNFIPSSVRNQFYLSDAELAEEQRKLVDWFTDDLYAPLVAAGGSLVRYNVSRFVCDPERFEDDEKECMVARGMGVVYTHGTELQRIRREITVDERESLLNDFYRPFHAALNEQVKRVVEVFGRCVFVDCHSYPERVLPYELYGDTPRADVVLGDDPIHTPTWIREGIERLVTDAGYTYGLNQPFAGTVVPLSFYGDARVSSFMLEIKRSTYMDERVTAKHEGFERVRSLIREVAEFLSRETGCSTKNP